MRDIEPTRGLPKGSHIVRIAAEGLNLAPDPEQRGNLIEQSFIAVRPQDRGVHPAKDAKPIVERDDHDIASHGQAAAIDPRLRARADRVAAAVNPDHDRALAVVASRCPDVQVKAVLRLRLRRDADQVANIAAELTLHRGGGELGRVAHAGPRIKRFRRSPAQFAERRLREGNAAKDDAAVVLQALKFAERSTDLRRHGGQSWLGMRDRDISMLTGAKTFS